MDVRWPELLPEMRDGVPRGFRTKGRTRGEAARHGDADGGAGASRRASKRWHDTDAGSATPVSTDVIDSLHKTRGKGVRKECTVTGKREEHTVAAGTY